MAAQRQAMGRNQRQAESNAPQCSRRELYKRGLLVSAVLFGAACGVSGDGTLPPNVQDPAILQTPSGALARYRGTLATLPGAFDGVVLTGGILTDELLALPMRPAEVGPYTGLDSRQEPSFSPVRLHRLRAQAREARGFLAAYAPDSSPALRGHLYALEGYADIFLADLFCSGIPLSTVDFDGNFTLATGSTTAEVYRHAVALFDTAFTLANDSVRFQHLAAIGRGRALLALGRYADAAAAVTAVPDDYRYQAAFTFGALNSTTRPDSAELFWFAQGPSARLVGAPSMADQEGGLGLNFRSSGDPRTVAWTRVLSDPSGNRFFFPRKYTTTNTAFPTSPVTFRMATGLEARLIEAEAALKVTAEDGRWLQLLNHLRQTAWSTIVPAVASPLDSLADPGPDGTGGNTLRENLLFRERAFWLYLTGHRQGDLRRLVREYQRAPETVYPVGLYSGGMGAYGIQTVVPMPEQESQLNPKYGGCFHRNA